MVIDITGREEASAIHRSTLVPIVLGTALALGSCTIGNTSQDPDVLTETATATATRVHNQERYLTETVSTTIAETTVTATETRWAIGDPRDIGVENQRLFGPYPSEEDCLPYEEARCEEREDGWYMVIDPPEEPAGDPAADPASGHGEPAEPREPVEPAPDPVPAPAED